MMVGYVVYELELATDYTYGFRIVDTDTWEWMQHGGHPTSEALYTRLIDYGMAASPNETREDLMETFHRFIESTGPECIPEDDPGWWAPPACGTPESFETLKAATTWMTQHGWTLGGQHAVEEY